MGPALLICWMGEKFSGRLVKVIGFLQRLILKEGYMERFRTGINNRYLKFSNSLEIIEM